MYRLLRPTTAHLTPRQLALTPFCCEHSLATIRMCGGPAAASVFICALIFFHNGRAQRTLETVCVIDDKTKYSAR